MLRLWRAVVMRAVRPTMLLLLLLLHVTAAVRLLLLPAACAGALPLQVVRCTTWLLLLLLLHVRLPLVRLLLLLRVPAVVRHPAVKPLAGSALTIAVRHSASSSSSVYTGWHMAVTALHSVIPRRLTLTTTSSSRRLTHRSLQVTGLHIPAPAAAVAAGISCCIRTRPLLPRLLLLLFPLAVPLQLLHWAVPVAW
jgi:hypothetical protein